MSQAHKNLLLLNSDKTEVVILGPKHLRDTLSNDEGVLEDISLIFDPVLSFDSHLWLISRTAFFHLRNINQ